MVDSGASRILDGWRGQKGVSRCLGLKGLGEGELLAKAGQGQRR